MNGKKGPERQSSHIFRTTTAGAQEPHQPFTKENVAELGVEFGLPSFVLPAARVALNQAASSYREELERSKYDRKSALRELKEVRKRLARLQESVDALSDDAEYYLARRSLGTAKSNRRLSLGRPTKELKKHQITSYLATVETTIEHTISKTTVSGRPAEEELAGVLISAYLLWVHVARREFSLDWTSENHPISDAAIWCTRVTKLIAPAIPQAKIRTAALKVRERSIKPKGLFNPLRYLVTYFKRSRLLK